MAKIQLDVTITGGKQIAAIRADLKKIKQELGLVSRSSKKTSKGFRDIGTSGKKASKDVQLLGTNLKGLGLAAVSTAAFQVSRAFIEMSDSATRVRTALKQVTGSETELNSVQGKLLDLSIQTRQSYEQTVSLYRSMHVASAQYGVTSEQMIQTITTLNQALAANNVEGAAAESVIYNFKQAMNKGILSGEDYNIMLEQAPDLIHAIAEHMGVTTEEMKKLADQQKITRDIIIDAWESVDGVADKFGKSVATVSEGMIAAESGATAFIGHLDEMFGISSAIAEKLKEAGEALANAAKPKTSEDLQRQYEWLKANPTSFGGTQEEEEAYHQRELAKLQLEINRLKEQENNLRYESTRQAALARYEDQQRREEAAAAAEQAKKDLEIEEAKAEAKAKAAKAAEDELARQKDLAAYKLRADQERAGMSGNDYRNEMERDSMKGEGDQKRADQAAEDQKTADRGEYIAQLQRELEMNQQLSEVGVMQREGKREELELEQMLNDLRGAGYTEEEIEKVRGLTLANNELTDSMRQQQELSAEFQSAWSSAIDSFAGDLAEGKANFKDFAKSIIKELIKIAIRAAITKAITGGFGFSEGGSVGFSKGGPVQGFASGGPVRGHGSTTSDSIRARLSNGEYVINAQAARQNRDTLDAINSGGSAKSAGTQLSVNVDNSAAKDGYEVQTYQEDDLTTNIAIIKDSIVGGEIQRTIANRFAVEETGQ